MMNPDTREFLLHESEQIWKHLDHIWQTRNRTIALYITALGALAAAALNVAPEPETCKRTGVGFFVLGPLLCLPEYFIATVVTFVAVVSIVASMLLIRFHTLAKEYVTTVNYVRRAFRDGDRSGLEPYLVLPADARVGMTRGIDLWILLTLSALGGLVLAVGAAHFLNWELLAGRPCRLGWAPPLVLPVWVLIWLNWYVHRSRATDAKLRKRLNLAPPSGNRRWQRTRKGPNGKP
jgi:hypothetical protein